MIHPSYVDLMQVVNKGVEEGETPVPEGEKPLSIAVEELNQGKIRILAENEPDEEEIVFEETDEEEYLEGDETAE